MCVYAHFIQPHIIWLVFVCFYFCLLAFLPTSYIFPFYFVYFARKKIIYFFWSEKKIGGKYSKQNKSILEKININIYIHLHMWVCVCVGSKSCFLQQQIRSYLHTTHKLHCSGAAATRMLRLRNLPHAMSKLQRKFKLNKIKWENIHSTAWRIFLLIRIYFRFFPPICVFFIYFFFWIFIFLFFGLSLAVCFSILIEAVYCLLLCVFFI